jgi:mannose-6-phosphate isomerase-like protein (cupin superfamily)
MTTSRPKAVATVQMDDARVKVTEWRFAPGAETGWHTHAMDYVVVPIAAGMLEIEMPDGKNFRAPLEIGGSYGRKQGTEHNVINASGHEVAFVEIELKS